MLLGDTGHADRKKWGWEEVLVNDEGGNYCLKRLCLIPMNHSSVHRHLVKHETFIVQTGRVHVYLNDGSSEEYRTLLPGEQLVVRPGTWHCFWSHEPASFYEVSTCHSDDDVERKAPSGPFDTEESLRWCGKWPAYPGNHRYLVIGDSMLDRYTFVTHGAAAQEAAVSRLHLNWERYLPGGAAHVAALLAKSGAAVDLFTCAADDTEGKLLETLLVEAGVQNPWVVETPNARTAVRHRIWDGNRLLHRVDSDLPSPTANLPTLFEACVAGVHAQPYTAIIICDHGKGVCSAQPDRSLPVGSPGTSLIPILKQLKEKLGSKIVLDPDPRMNGYQAVAGALDPWLVKCNYGEAGAYLEGSVADGSMPIAYDVLRSIHNVVPERVVVTGEDSCTWAELNKDHDPESGEMPEGEAGIVKQSTSVREGTPVFASRSPAPRSGVDVVGAGDEFLARLVPDLIGGIGMHVAVTGAHVDMRQRVSVPRIERWPWI